MSGWLRWMVLSLCVLQGFRVGVAAPAGAFTEELDTDLYDCTLVLKPAAKLPAGSVIRLVLEKQAANGIVIIFSRTTATIVAVREGKETPYAQVALPEKSGFPLRILIQRRAGKLGLRCNDQPLFRSEVPRAPGTYGTLTVGKGWADPQISVQRLEPVAFADNFMRTADEHGPWTVVSGAWALQSAWDQDPKGNARRFDNAEFALNPFAWIGKGGEKPALCMAGQAYWEDYTLTASLRPAADGAVGLAVNLQDAQHGYLVRWTPVYTPGRDGNRLTLCKMTQGKLTVVAESPGGYLPGQWYRLSVISTLEGMQVLIDGRERLQVANATPWRGGVGLYVEGGNAATFDDITVYGSTLKKELIAENVLARLNERFVEDHKGMGQWATAGIDWTDFPGKPGVRLYRWDSFGDHWIVTTVVRNTTSSGEIRLTLNGDGADVSAGYHAVIDIPDGKGQTACTLYRNGDAVAARTIAAFESGVEYDLRFAHIGSRLRLEIDGETVLDAEGGQALAGFRPAYRVTGGVAAKGTLVLGRNVIDETFAEAPVDWVGEGIWMSATRWACSPQWSFLAGWNRGDAVLWRKQRFRGDHTFEAFLAPKMEYPREHDTYEGRFRDMAITICGDGHDPRTGYTGILGAPDELGNPNRRSVLMRNGQVVGSSYQRMPDWANGHIEWFNLVLQKRGATVEFWVEGRRVAAFTDPEPLEGGVPAIWTANNGVVIARSRLHFAQPPQPRTDPLVIIDNPWYPEWANIGQSLSLAFEAMSTTGKPMQFRVTPQQAPADDAQAVTVEKNRITFTPTALGQHWYRVTATDGETTSPAMHLALPVFRPDLGRDDSHALVLYRFDEGTGKTVKDHSTVEPRLDLTVGEKSMYEWYPGQGLRLTGPSRLMTAAGADKLMKIAETKACTLEFWLSPDTIFPLTDWLGVILTWELPGEKRNFGFAQQAYFWTFSPRGTYFGSRFSRVLTVQGARNGLQHVAVTWDGRSTRLYVNGARQAERFGSWQPENWYADAPLILGNQPEGEQRSYMYEARSLTGARPDIINRQAVGQHCFLGTYYLAAIHDRCLDEGEITRHYQAGPSAR